MHLGALIAIVILLVVSAFLVLAEFATVRVRPTQLESLLERDPRGKFAMEVQRNLSRHLSSVLVGISICAIALGAIGEAFFAHLLQGLFVWLPWPGMVAPLTSAGALLLMTTLSVVLTELVPRGFALRNAGKWALRTALPLLLWSKLVFPLTWALTHLSRAVERMLGLKAAQEHGEDLLPSEEEFRRMLEKSQAKGTLGLSRAELIENLFQFSKRTTQEIAIPRHAVVCFDLNRSLEENLRLARTTPHSRIPLIEGDLDHVVGIVHMKDLLWALHEKEGHLDLRALARPTFFVPEMKRIQELLLAFQQQKQHLAMVVNEHGGVDGLVTLEDVLEELVGEIQDEFDREAIQLRPTKGGAWIAQGHITREQLEQHLNLFLEVEAGSITLGGYFQEKLGRVVRVGDELRIPGWRIRVLSTRGLAPGQFLLRPAPEEPGGTDH